MFFAQKSTMKVNGKYNQWEKIRRSKNENNKVPPIIFPLFWVFIQTQGK